MRIKPRPGVVLPGIPSAGADVPAELGREWIEAGLATAVGKPKAKAPAKASKPAAPAKEG